MQTRNRVRELRRVKAADLVPNPKNWRTHPKGQQDALRGILAEVGYADALLARELPDGSLMLVDGHLRAETTPEQEVPVLIPGGIQWASEARDRSRPSSRWRRATPAKGR